jgi:hypothetical protein
VGHNIKVTEGVFFYGVLKGDPLNRVHRNLISVRKKTRVCKKKMSSSRLAKRQKAEFTEVIEHFWRKRNEEIGVFLQTIINFVNPII